VRESKQVRPADPVIRGLRVCLLGDGLSGARYAPGQPQRAKLLVDIREREASDLRELRSRPADHVIDPFANLGCGVLPEPGVVSAR
jgi:hypothetical protein